MAKNPFQSWWEEYGQFLFGARTDAEQYKNQMEIAWKAGTEYPIDAIKPKLNTTYDEGYECGYDEGYDEGYAEGHECGYADAELARK